MLRLGDINASQCLLYRAESAGECGVDIRAFFELTLNVGCISGFRVFRNAFGAFATSRFLRSIPSRLYTDCSGGEYMCVLRLTQHRLQLLL